MDAPTLAYARMSFSQAVYSVNEPKLGIYAIALGRRAAEIVEANSREDSVRKLYDMFNFNVAEIAPHVNYEVLAERAVNYIQVALDESALESV